MIHERRVTGSLVDRGLKVDETGVPREALTRALTWLRKKYPLDEQDAATRWAGKEVEKAEGSYVARAERLGLINRPSELAQQSESTSSLNTRDSVIDQMQEYNRQRGIREAEERRKSGEEERSHEMQLAERARGESEQKNCTLRIKRKNPRGLF